MAAPCLARTPGRPHSRLSWRCGAHGHVNGDRQPPRVVHRGVRDLLELELGVLNEGDPGREAQDASPNGVAHRGQEDVQPVPPVRRPAAVQESGHAEDAHVGNAVLKAGHDEGADGYCHPEEFALHGLGRRDDEHRQADQYVGGDRPEEDLVAGQARLLRGDAAIDLPRGCEAARHAKVAAGEEDEFGEYATEEVGTPNDDPVLDHLVPIDPAREHGEEEKAVPRVELRAHA
mmetsp:Transcript_34157/g.106595  ORF Transcript_34157/g.106595 Transcript_34157/m.106595 type:complete len:232 (-) Transcript_34157:329-1024(-)